MVSFYRLLAIAGLAGFVHSGPAVTAEWTLAANVGQSFQVDSNFQLDDRSQGTLFGSNTRLGLNLGGRTKTTSWNLSSGTTLSYFTGRGNSSGLNRSSPAANGGIFHQGKRISVSGAFDFSRQSVAFTQFGLTLPPAGSIILPDNTVILPDNTVATLDDFQTISNEKAVVTNLNLRGGVTVPLDPLNSLSLSASGNIVRFSKDAIQLADFTSYGTRVSWAHSLTQLTTANLSFGVQRFTADNVENTESISFITTGGLGTQLSPRLDFGFNAGVNVADIQRDPPGRDDTPIGFTGGFRLGYRLSDTSYSLFAKQGFDTSSLGELQSRSTFGLSAAHKINDRSRIALSGSYSRQVSAGNSNGTNRQLFALSPSYSYDLTSKLTAQLRYSARLSDTNSGFATSNNFVLSISRSFDLLH